MHRCAVSEDGDPVANGAQFVEPVRDVNDAYLPFAELAHDAENFRAFRVGERRSGFVENLARFGRDGAAVDKTESGRSFAAQEDILRHTQMRRQQRFLMNHGYALRGRFGRTGEGHGLAAKKHFAAVAFVNTGGDLH